MAVTFLVPHTVGTSYNPGEIAGFDPAVEADLVRRGIADPFVAGDAQPDGDRSDDDQGGDAAKADESRRTRRRKPAAE
jgi:hypothetical protein